MKERRQRHEGKQRCDAAEKKIHDSGATMGLPSPIGMVWHIPREFKLNASTEGFVFLEPELAAKVFTLPEGADH